jgi:hypothetical protein
VAGGIVPKTPVVPPPADLDPGELRAVEQANEQRARAFFQLAKTTSKNQLTQEVRAEKERIRQGEAVQVLRFFVAESAVTEWHLARKLARQKSASPLSEGQAFTFVVRDFVKRHDKDDLGRTRAVRARRMAPTAERPDARTIPCEVRREVMARARGHCEFPGCSNGTYLQFCHIRPHAAGGDREAGNFVLLCHAHHAMMDLGTLRVFERTAEGVAFVDTATGEVFAPDPRRNAAEVLPRAPAGRRATAPAAGEPSGDAPGVQSDSRSCGSPGAASAGATYASAQGRSGQVSECAPRWRPRGATVASRRRPGHRVGAGPPMASMPRWRRVATDRQSRIAAHFR